MFWIFKYFFIVIFSMKCTSLIENHFAYLFQADCMTFRLLSVPSWIAQLPNSTASAVKVSNYILEVAASNNQSPE